VEGPRDGQRLGAPGREVGHRRGEARRRGDDPPAGSSSPSPCPPARSARGTHRPRWRPGPRRGWIDGRRRAAPAEGDRGAGRADGSGRSLHPARAQTSTARAACSSSWCRLPQGVGTHGRGIVSLVCMGGRRRPGVACRPQRLGDVLAHSAGSRRSVALSGDWGVVPLAHGRRLAAWSTRPIPSACRSGGSSFRVRRRSRTSVGVRRRAGLPCRCRTACGRSGASCGMISASGARGGRRRRGSICLGCAPQGHTVAVRRHTAVTQVSQG
jgi:hypothetical protein